MKQVKTVETVLDTFKTRNMKTLNKKTKQMFFLPGYRNGYGAGPQPDYSSTAIILIFIFKNVCSI